MLLQVLLVSLAYVIVYPSFKGLANSCVDDVSQPLTRQQMQFFFVWQVCHKLRILLCFGKHAFYANVLVLRTENFKVLVRLDAYSC